MNAASILMCWDVPKIDEELLFELFCVAGPIEAIQYGSSGRSCFIIYEHPDAVATAKEIFRGVRIKDRLIHFFDQNDINEIHAQQEITLIANEKQGRSIYLPPRSSYASNLMQDPRAFAVNNYSSPSQKFNPNFSRSQPTNTHIRFDDDGSSPNDNRNLYNSPSNYSRIRSDLMPTARTSQHHSSSFSHPSRDKFEKESSDIFMLITNPYGSPVPKNRNLEDDTLPPGVSNDEFKREDKYYNGPNYGSLSERPKNYDKFDYRDQDNMMGGLVRENNRDHKWRKLGNRDYNSRTSDNQHYSSSSNDDRNYNSRNNDYVARNRYNNQRNQKYTEYRSKGRY